MIEFLVGIDGGGSGTRAVLSRPQGGVIARGTAGPSALGQGIGQAWAMIELSVRQCFAHAQIAPPPWPQCALAAGLSGVHNPAWRAAFVQANIGFASLLVDTDAFTMTLGAHRGQPGAVIAAGTGSAGEALHADGHRIAVGGWGFPAGDEGSGAWLGLRAMGLTQAAVDGRAPAGALTRAVQVRCGAGRDALQQWCARAGQFDYGQLGLVVFDCAETDPVADALLNRAAAHLARMALALEPPAQPSNAQAVEFPFALCGSVAKALAPRLPAPLLARCTSPLLCAEEGALLWLRNTLARLA